LQILAAVFPGAVGEDFVILACVVFTGQQGTTDGQTPLP